VKPTIVDAITSLVPDAVFNVKGEQDITWINYDVPPVTSDDLLAEHKRLLSEYERNEYQRLRAAAYPPAADYLDGVAKGDQAQIDKYVADCLAVKAKYPKPAS